METINILELIDIANKEQDRISQVFDWYESPIVDMLYTSFIEDMWLSTIQQDIESIWIYDLIKGVNDGYSISRFKDYDDVYDIITDEEISNEQKIRELDRVKKAYYVYKLKNI